MNQTHDALGTYVVGALEPDERSTFERHLETCATCRVEVVGLTETAARLGVLASAPPPPEALRSAVLANLPAVPQLPAPARGPQVDDLATRRLQRRNRALGLLVAAVSVLALSLGGVVVSLTQHDQAPVAGSSADTTLLSAPDARILPATFADGTQASLVVSRSQNRALFVARDLPDLGPGKTYEIWLTRGAVAHPDSLVAGGEEVSAWLHGSVSDASGFAVTVEPAGGSRTPTSPVLASGTV